MKSLQASTITVVLILVGCRAPEDEPSPSGAGGDSSYAESSAAAGSPPPPPAPPQITCPTNDTGAGSWRPLDSSDAPTDRAFFAYAWTGDRLFIGGGAAEYPAHFPWSDAWSYTPAGDTWAELKNSPLGRDRAAGVWTGSEFVVWGGKAPIGPHGDLFWFNDGAAYNPTLMQWHPIAQDISARAWHTAVWTGTEMIVWGGDGPHLGGGARWDPSTDSWTQVADSKLSCTTRAGHTATWTGSKMIVWGGRTDTMALGAVLNDGSIYDPVTDSWTLMSLQGAASPRHSHTAVWTGDRLLVWGGLNEYNSSVYSDGAAYDPATDTWSPLYGGPEVGAGVAVWTGSVMIVWGGAADGRAGLYDPVTDTWKQTRCVPAFKEFAAAVWTDTEMLVWGGRGTPGGFAFKLD